MAGLNLHKPILVVAKKSMYEVYGLERKDPGFLAVLKNDPCHANNLMRSHEENRRAIEMVLEYLSSRGLSFIVSSDLTPPQEEVSLIVSVGGDGTLLAASHLAENVPVVGVNSRPGSSIGRFCPADRGNFRRVLDSIFSGRREARELMRMDIWVNGVHRSPHVLNDLLFAGTTPASAVMYNIRLDEVEEYQRSSGVWVSTPAGSTAGIHAAGGRKMPLSEEKMQFLVREPYRGKGIEYRLQRGIFRDGLSITNLTPDGIAYLDGARIQLRLAYGDVLEPKRSPSPLKIYL